MCHHGLDHGPVSLVVDIPRLNGVDGIEKRRVADAAPAALEGLASEYVQARILLHHRRKILCTQEDMRVVIERVPICRPQTRMEWCHGEERVVLLATGGKSAERTADRLGPQERIRAVCLDVEG